MRLAGKRALIVGAGQTPGETIGNGRATALLFAREGATVLCVDRDAARAEETAALIRDEGHVAAAITADITATADCAAMAEAAGVIDILINNAGIFGDGDGPAHRLDEAALDRILDVNVKGMWRTIAAILPGMRERRCGAIVNISSLAAIAGGHQLAYEMSKAAVNRLTTSTAFAQARHGVRCNAIQLGAIDTPLAMLGISAQRGIDLEALRTERNARVPLGRMGTAWDCAEAALFLASDAARFITGAILPVDGGASVRIG